MTAAELDRRPTVVAGGVVHSSLDPEPPPDSPLHPDRYRGALRWSPKAREDITASVAHHSRPRFAWLRGWLR